MAIWKSYHQFTHFWSRSLEVLHDAYCGPKKEDTEPERDQDFIVGRYTYITHWSWADAKYFMSKAAMEAPISRRHEPFQHAREVQHDCI